MKDLRVNGGESAVFLSVALDISMFHLHTLPQEIGLRGI